MEMGRETGKSIKDLESEFVESTGEKPNHPDPLKIIYQALEPEVEERGG